MVSTTEKANKLKTIVNGFGVVGIHFTSNDISNLNFIFNLWIFFIYCICVLYSVWVQWQRLRSFVEEKSFKRKDLFAHFTFIIVSLCSLYTCRWLLRLPEYKPFACIFKVDWMLCVRNYIDWMKWTRFCYAIFSSFCSFWLRFSLRIQNQCISIRQQFGHFSRVNTNCLSFYRSNEIRFW